MGKDKNILRKELLGIESKIKLRNGKKVCQINFDNAATTPPLRSVVCYINELIKYYGSIGRGTGQKSTKTTELYNDSKEYLLDFFNVRNKDDYTVIFVNNTTDGINKIAQTLLSKDDLVLTTRMEHHSNDLPWRVNCMVDYVEVDMMGRLDYDSLNEKLNKYSGKFKFLSIAGASNVTGYINDIHRISALVHNHGGKIIVDGAQLVPHIKVDMKGKSSNEDIDFLVFSAHKLYAPFGSGVIIGRKEDFNKNFPDREGGGIVELVKDFEVKYLETPERNEAGTPNFFGVMAMVKALKSLDQIGFDNLINREKMLFEILNKGLNSIPNVINYGDTENINDRLGISVFNIKNLYHKDVATMLALDKGIAVRHGMFCAHPYCRRLINIDENKLDEYLKYKNDKMPGMVRVSLSSYNTKYEIYELLNEIEYICKKYSGK